MVSDGIGYVFDARPTVNGCVFLTVMPHDQRNDFPAKAYVLTRSEALELYGKLEGVLFGSGVVKGVELR